MLIDNLDVSTLGPFKCYVTQRGGVYGLSAFPGNSVMYGSTLITLFGDKMKCSAKNQYQRTITRKLTMATHKRIPNR